MKLLFSTIALVLVFAGFAQEDCSTALPLVQSEDCATQVYTTVGATNSGVPTECGTITGGDNWFSVEVPASGMFSIQSTSVSNVLTTLTLYSGACGDLTPIDCSTDNSTLDNVGGGLIVNNASLAGQTVFLRVFMTFNSTGAEYSLCFDEVESPSNDFCSDATVLVPTSNIDFITYSNKNATGKENNAGCGFYEGGDVWFAFEMPADGAAMVTTEKIASFTPTVGLYTGDCSSLNLIDCDFSISPDNSGQITLNDPSLAGEIIYVQVYSYASYNGDIFNLSIVDVTIPDNNTCSTAQSLPVAENGTYFTYSNLYATDSEDAPPSCGFYEGGDVWFTFTAPADGQFRIDTDKIGTYFPVVALYSGTCGALELVDCDFTESVGNSGLLIINDASLGGQDLFIRAYSYANANGGDFGMAVENTTAPANDFCENLLPLTATEYGTFVEYSNLNATDSEDGSGCGFYRGGDIWFSFTAPADGQFVLTSSRVGTNYYPVLSLYSGTCDDLVAIDCDFTESLDNSGQLIFNDASMGGQDYILRVYSYANYNGGPMNIGFHDVLSPENDFCENATPINSVGACNMQTYSNQFATDSPANVPASCGFTGRGDVWFTAQATADGVLYVDSDRVGPYFPVVNVLSGTCENLTLIECSFNGSTTNSGYVELNDPVFANETLYIRIASFGTNEGNIFDLCAYGCSFDLDSDQQVNVADLLILIAEFGCTGPNCVADYDNDNTVSASDLIALIGAFGIGCSSN